MLLLFELTVDDQVYSFGSGTYGQLGHGDEENRLVPTKVMALENVHVAGVACGGFHTIVWTIGTYMTVHWSSHTMVGISAVILKLQLRK